MIATALLAATLGATAPPVLVEIGDCWAVGWSDQIDQIHVVAGDDSDRRSFNEAMTASLTWYPWIFPGRGGPTPQTPMQQCFAEARDTCRAQGEKVCFVYWIPGYGQAGEGACFIGCSVNMVCGNPPPIPPVPAMIGGKPDALVVQTAAWHAATLVWMEVD